MEKIKLITYLVNNDIKPRGKYMRLNDGELRTPSEWETFINENKTW
jgi:hypothetical protein